VHVIRIRATIAGVTPVLGGSIEWRPSRDQAEGSRLWSFIQRHGLRDLDELHRRSVSDPEWFWGAVIEELGLEFYEPMSRVLDTSRGVPWATWCVGGSLNIAHGCLDRWVATPLARKPALRWEGEEGRVRTLTYAELLRDVARCANGLRDLGIRRGDRVAVFMPMCPQLAVAFFAVIRIGGVVLPLFSGYGADAVAQRLNDAAARVLVTADGFLRRGRRVDMKRVADEAVSLAPGVERVVVAPRLADEPPAASDREVAWSALLAGRADTCEPEHTDAEDPLMLIYTSGTSGRPKGAVHTHCGFPVKTAQDMLHGFDVRSSDTVYWVTDMGWMMGPWLLLGSTLLGATTALYDGALDHPGPDRLWAFCERHGVSVLGVSPTLVRSLMPHGDGPVRAHDLTALRMFGSTGEPWDPDSWHWLFRTVGGSRLPIINYSGGTEVSGGLLVGNWLSPIKPCSFAGPPPGIDAAVVDESGRPLEGEVGELVVRAPWIGMTRGFWQDPERYLQTYWSRFPDTWVHGDWAVIDEDGAWFILGRSDDTIKVAGKRLGPAEVESVLLEHPAVVQALAFGVPDPLKGQTVVCLCVTRDPDAAPGDLSRELASLVADRLGKPLRPKVVAIVRDLPRTRNGKIMRRVARAAFLGDSVGDVTALENADVVAEISAAGQAGR